MIRGREQSLRHRLKQRKELGTSIWSMSRDLETSIILSQVLARTRKKSKRIPRW